MAENKVIDTITNKTPIPAKEDRKHFHIPFVNTKGTEPVGGNLTLEDMLEAEATQEELEALQQQITDNKNAQDTKNKQQDTEIAKKVDSTVQEEKDNAQDTEIALKANKSDADLFLMTTDTTNFKLDGNRLPAPLEQVAHVRVNKKFIDGDVAIEGLKEQPENPLAFDFRPEDMAEGGVMLKNEFTKETTDYLTVTGTTVSWGGIASLEATRHPNLYNRKVYTRGVIRWNSLGEGQPDSARFRVQSTLLTDDAKITEFNKDYLVSGVTVMKEPTYNNLSVFVYPKAPKAGVSYSISVKDVVLIDITELSRMFPTYTDEQLKNLCDMNIPYISAGQSQYVDMGVVLKNISQHTNEYKDAPYFWSQKALPSNSYAYMRGYTLPLNKKYYMAVEIETTADVDESSNSIYTSVGTFSTSSVIQTNKQVKKSTSYRFSCLFNLTEIIGEAFIGLSNTKAPFVIKDNACNLIDITDLSARYPQYSDEELKTILDNSLPYISAGQSRTLGGVCKLENVWGNPFEWKHSSAVSVSDKGDFVEAVLPNAYNRIFNDYAFDAKDKYYVNTRISHTTKTPEVINIGNSEKWNFGFGGGFRLNSDSNSIVANRFGAIANEPSLSFFVMTIDGGAVVQVPKKSNMFDVTEPLLDLQLSLMGYSTDEQKAEWCNEHIPPFEGTYDLWIGAIKDEHTLTARCGEYVSALTFKTVFNNRSVATQPYVDNALRDKADVITNPRRGESPLVCTDSDEEPLLGMTIFGKTEQFTTTGKNLMDVKSYSWRGAVVEGDVVKIDFNTSSSFYQILYKQVIAGIVRNKTYTFSIDKTVSKNVSIVIYYADSTDKSYYISGKSISFTTADKEVTGVSITIGGSAPLSCKESLRFQLEPGNEATSYEPYTGGKASPNPDYPQEIKNAMVQRISDMGKNIADPVYLLPAGLLYQQYAREYGVKLYAGITYSIWLDAPVHVFKITYLNNHSKNLIYEYDVQTISVTPTETDLYYMEWKIEEGNPRKKIQIEINNHSTSYEPFKGKIAELSKKYELTKWDRIEKHDGIWGITNKTVSFDGSMIRSINILTNTVRLYIKEPRNGIGDYPMAYCNMLRRDVDYAGDFEHYYVAIDSAQIFINKDRLKALTVEAAKDYLVSKHFKIIFEAKDEFWTPLPQEDQDILNSLMSYNPVTVMDVGTEVEIKYRAETSRIVKQMARDIAKEEIAPINAILNKFMGKVYISDKSTGNSNDSYAVLPNNVLVQWGYLKFNRTSTEFEHLYKRKFAEGKQNILFIRYGKELVPVNSSSFDRFNCNSKEGLVCVWFAIGQDGEV